MNKRKNSKLRNRKAQFFVISSVLVALVVFVAADMLNSYSEIDVNQVREDQTPFAMRNIVSKMNKTKNMRTSPHTPSVQERDLARLLNEWSSGKGFRIEIELGNRINISVSSPRLTLKKTL